MTLEELYNTANELTQKHWAINYTGKIELVNANWKCLGAKIILDNPSIIRMSKKVNKKIGEEEIKQNLLHELVHWFLYTMGKDYDDGSKDFAVECARVGAPFSSTKKAQWAAAVYTNKGRRIGT